MMARIGRSVVAMLIGVALNVALALAIDELFHLLGVYPPWSAPMNETGDNLLALSYRLAITVFAGVVVLRFADYAPAAHAIAYGAIGLGLGLLGVMETTAPGADFGPDWYPWSIALTAVPCAWIAWLIVRRTRKSV